MLHVENNSQSRNDDVPAFPPKVEPTANDIASHIAADVLSPFKQILVATARV